MTEAHFFIGQTLFVKGILLCYFCAFASLLRQVTGLFGASGILPIDELMRRAKARIEKKRFYWVPTLFWLRSDNCALKGVLLCGLFASILGMANVAPPLMLIFLWLFYLSFVSVGAPFLHYQWDVLLLEAGFAAIFFSMTSPPPLFLLFWLWILALRFLLSSGLVKLLSKCPEWRSLKAMRYHFETQPLPNLGGYLAHQVFSHFPSLATSMVYFFELAVPFLFLGSDAMRALGAYLSILFQVAILLTGNFAFFNLLTITLCFPLLSDVYVQWAAPYFSPLQNLPSHLGLNLFLNGVGIVMITLNLVTFARLFRNIIWIPRFFSFLSRFYILNDYGLFARMTTVRNEIILEGSEDGTVWKEYAFSHKPDALQKAPTQIAPFQPRLDWQLWFSALSSHPQDVWWQYFIDRLLEGSPDVLGLQAENPFSTKPPAYIRAHLYRYRFTTLKEWYETGRYWNRTYVGAYMRPVSLSKK